MPHGSRARVRDAAPAVAEPSRSSPPGWTTPQGADTLHGTLTPKDREVIQDWMAKRYLQVHEKRIGRRRGDLPMPASVRSASQAERFVNYNRKANQGGR